MKKVSFEINSEYRMLENSELVSLLIGNKQTDILKMKIKSK